MEPFCHFGCVSGLVLKRPPPFKKNDGRKHSSVYYPVWVKAWRSGGLWKGATIRWSLEFQIVGKDHLNRMESVFRSGHYSVKEVWPLFGFFFFSLPNLQSSHSKKKLVNKKQKRKASGQTEGWSEERKRGIWEKSGLRCWKDSFKNEKWPRKKWPCSQLPEKLYNHKFTFLFA